MNAEIIIIGNEVIQGKQCDTNSGDISRALAEIGIDVERITTVKDDVEAICAAIKQNEPPFPLKILTGGLGITTDDVTVSALATYFQSEMKTDVSLLLHIQNLLQQRNYPQSAIIERQAIVPEKAGLFFNDIGIAPGFVFEEDGQIIISLPGVPHEMNHLLKSKVLPFLKAKSQNEIHNITHDFLFSDIGETFLCEQIKLKSKIFEHFDEVAFLPSPGTLILRLTLRCSASKENASLFDMAENELRLLFPDNFAGKDVSCIANVIQEFCIANKQTVAVAESCSGGYLSHMITSVPGASAYFKGGVVSYANEIKTNMLGVQADDILEHGAVSKQVVEQMAHGVRLSMGADFSVAVSGIAGPDGGSAEKPVGTVWIAVDSDNGTLSRKVQFGAAERGVIIQKASVKALHVLFQMIKTVES